MKEILFILLFIIFLKCQECIDIESSDNQLSRDIAQFGWIVGKKTTERPTPQKIHSTHFPISFRRLVDDYQVKIKTSYNFEKSFTIPSTQKALGYFHIIWIPSISPLKLTRETIEINIDNRYSCSTTQTLNFKTQEIFNTTNDIKFNQFTRKRNGDFKSVSAIWKPDNSLLVRTNQNWFSFLIPESCTSFSNIKSSFSDAFNIIKDIPSYQSWIYTSELKGSSTFRHRTNIEVNYNENLNFELPYIKNDYLHTFETAVHGQNLEIYNHLKELVCKELNYSNCDFVSDNASRCHGHTSIFVWFTLGAAGIFGLCIGLSFVTCCLCFLIKFKKKSSYQEIQ